MKYYKYRNGSSSFEYDVEEQLNQIRKLQESKNESILCGVFSAVLSNFISAKVNDSEFIFVILLIIFYIVALYFVRFLKKFVYFIKAFVNRKDFSEEEERKKKEVFFSKIVNETVMGISLVNRVNNLKEKGEKEELWYIYALQALHCFEKTAQYLEKEYFRKTKEKKTICIKSVGAKALLWVTDNALIYLDKIQSNFNGIDIKVARDYFERIKKELSEYSV